ncbi:magnesium transporter CorA family protein [Porphyromonas crevioricanis]|uniref:Magnesium transporter CorA n=1 Tax=Porphyromonas crevioricanis TaxID=393921 RepID=A0AB34PF35_9PORP|nr:magnesium transporter CorA family protein [Porphyromonas crevioricanis]KGN94030.1 magnesium transporter CorA [Porphyromonas crevioricanis]
MKRYIYPFEGFCEKSSIESGCWVSLESPGTAELNSLVTDLGVPETFISDIADTDERPRTEEEDGWLLTILRIPIEIIHDEDVTYSTVPLGVITSETQNIIVSICYFETRILPDFIGYSRRKNISVDTQANFLLRLLHSSAVWFLKYLKQVNVEVTRAESALEQSISNEDLLQLMKLQKSLVYFNTSIRGNEALIGKLRTIYRSEIDDDLNEDVMIEMRQAYNMVNIYSDILTGTMDAFASIISNNVNTIMKRMTSISMLLMIPTLIASLYGMNVELPAAEKSYAFLLVLAVSIFLSVVVFWVFRRLKWL